jgi:hypothetical protein
MAPESVNAVSGRLTFQEQFKLVELPGGLREGRTARRFMSQRAAYVPGSDLPIPRGSTPGGLQSFIHKAAFGGHVYSQAGLAASKTFALNRANTSDATTLNTFGIHVSNREKTKKNFITDCGVYPTT